MALKASCGVSLTASKTANGQRSVARMNTSRASAVIVHAALNLGAEIIPRRQLLNTAALSVVLLSSAPAAFAAKGPKGFNPVEDLSDGYRFLYPFGWQEVNVTGADIVYKDIIEPLETVSVTLLSTDKKEISDYGSLQEVSETLARNVLTAPGSEVKVLAASEREDDKGHKYYEFEFTANAGFTKHQLAVVTVANGKFYTLTVGSNERRWGKMKDKLATTAKSFQLIF